MKPGAYVVMTVDIPTEKRNDATRAYYMSKTTFYNEVDGAISKELLLRDKDMKIVAGFSSLDKANAYLKNELFTKDLFTGMKKYSTSEPDVEVYSVD